MDRNDIERLVNVEQGIQRLESSFNSGFERLDGKMDLYLQGVNKDISEVREDVKDHRGRIRSLEKWAWSIPPTILIALVSLVGFLLESGVIG